MRYLHTMVRVKDLEASLKFYCDGLGLFEQRRMESEKGRFTLVFLAAPEDRDLATPTEALRGQCHVELTYNWPDENGVVEDYQGGRNFGHLAYEFDDIYAICQHLSDMGVVINRPPRDGMMAFVRSPDGISVELLQKGAALPPAEPWRSMPNTGEW
jgi:lactoylglutathione lyase